MDFIARDCESLMKEMAFKDYIALRGIDSDVISEYLSTCRNKVVIDDFDSFSEDSSKTKEKPE